MTRIPFSLALLAVLAACDNAQPLIFPEDQAEVDPAEEVEEDEVSGSDPESDAIPETIDEILALGTLLVDLSGTRDDRGDISRTEARSGSGGVARDFLINADDDTLEVDNLAFDGLNIYTRGADLAPTKLSDLGTVAVYHGDETVPDFLTGNPVGQIIPYVGLYDESDVLIVPELDSDGLPIEARTSFTIVRTGGYTGYGFGGFGYRRSGDVVIAETGQATFSGDYAGVRVYDQIAQAEVTSGDITIDIDFDDFNNIPGVKGVVTNRQAYTPEGTLIPTYRGIDRSDIDFVAAGFDDQGVYVPAIIDPNTGAVRPYEVGDVIQLPDLPFVVRAFGESIGDDGEISGEVRNRFVPPDAPSDTIAVYEEGFYYGIIAGDTTSGDGGEVVGVIVTESPDSRYKTITAQETGGFIASR